MLLAALFVAPVAIAAPKKPDITVVHKEVDLVFHADTDFTPAQRDAITKASEEWRKLSNGRVRIVVLYDLDFNSMSSLREHKDKKHNVMIAIPSAAPLVQEVDEQAAERAHVPTAQVQVQAFTIPPGRAPIVAMWIVTDRVRPESFRQIVQHEMGHAVGLDDLPTVDTDIMSGAITGAGDAREFTERDRALCRAARYCD